MKTIERVAVWLGGYSPLTVSSELPEERERISKIGAAVFFAVSVAIINWGIAGWVYSEGLPTANRLVVIFITSSFGASVVLIFDRSFLYFHDTAKAGTGIKTAAYLLIRILIIMTVGTITSQAVVPLLLNDELKVNALQMIEDR